MDKSNLWSLRLGFSGKEAAAIEKLGFEKFLKKSYVPKFDKTLPTFLDDDPKTLAELKVIREQIKNADAEEKKKILKKEIYSAIEFKKWWIGKMQSDEFPLREKMVCFWHNHFVATSQKVKVNYWIYQHNMILREHAFGNFKELTKQIVKSNAMVKYLDNVDNKKGKFNENLSRELLELFTIGIGNYTENDIKEGARALAGLNLGDESAVYRKFAEDNSDKTYFGKTGNWKADDLVDLIFEQKNIPYLITRKILKWFLYDAPSEELVTYYGDYFRKVNFEIEPLLTKIFTEEYAKDNSGKKIKDPLVYIFQLIDELQLKDYNAVMIVAFLKQQGMDLYNQVNVKGWDGGNSWLTSQVYLQRNNTSDLLCSGRSLSKKTINNMMSEDNAKPKDELEKKEVKIQYDSGGNNKTIIAELSDRLLFNVNESVQKDMENLLKYDFDPKNPNANFAVIRLFNYITKLPEFQLI
ncbi:DUF1800 domain-containing protein [Flavobacterium sp. Fl-77]|uniref:DUF1800 domain-containing protein n=1 Tax=Flavobacterium flavipigmentatum TaxID=2893884 RepID=A0AAJ2SCT9_9FLAO|nr:MULTISPECIES: DUF1800 domain-containing protein [unclassified Flavobacterium]MDX6180556.1 DUF1800 domain-containing protein [Flavobacterium sp. Fl-33]MDX6184156.1 DUF1800 domain-containing protein [Flavobacterium sp. Fl-77]UFH39271.1 DUF1800 domain-containing protein [Flavobacterium sp. F-70]